MRPKAKPVLISSMIAGLALVAGAAHAAPRHPPKGSYLASCESPVLSNTGVLTAQCRDHEGRLVPAVLRTPDCGKGDIANSDGRLTCPPLFVARTKSKPPPKAPGPLVGPGSLTLYADIDYKGKTLELVRDVADLNLSNFNNVASSIRVRGGVWQLCADAQFKGHCTLVDKDTPNLTRFGLNDKITSIRRMG